MKPAQQPCTQRLRILAGYTPGRSADIGSSVRRGTRDPSNALSPEEPAFLAESNRFDLSGEVSAKLTLVDHSALRGVQPWRLFVRHLGQAPGRELSVGLPHLVK